MFRSPNLGTGEDQQMIDGVLVVELSDDSDDLAHLLNALHDKTFNCPPERCDFKVVVAILRVASKYDMQLMRQRAIFALSSMYPTTYDDMKKTQEDADKHRLVYDEDDVSVVAIARESDAKMLLPSAFYFIVNDHMWDAAWDHKSRKARNIRRLTKQDLMVCFAGRERLREALRSTMSRFIDGDNSQGCTGPNCSTEKLKFYASRTWKEYNENPAILAHTLVAEWMDETSVRNLCTVCRDTFKKSLESGREKIWDALPGYFDLPSWDVLNGSTSSQ